MIISILFQMRSACERLERHRDLSRHCVHIDMDSYFASVEMRDDPSLRTVPMAVGGTSMLSTANYEARKFGVRSGMPGFIALKLCPTLQIVPCNFSKYRKNSEVNCFHEFIEFLIIWKFFLRTR